MTKADDYRVRLRSLDEWDDYLLKESGLPGPRGNLELAQVVADEGVPTVSAVCGLHRRKSPGELAYEFLAFCGVVGLGRLLAEGDAGLLTALRSHASDPRWRIREAVAMALQRLGDVDMPRLISAMREWSAGTPLEQRAAAAALCGPRLLGLPEHARAVLSILDAITSSVERAEDRQNDAFVALRKGLGYCWSVAVAALPGEGTALMEKWLVKPDKDIRWIMKENLSKARLARVDAEWVDEWRTRISAPGGPSQL